MRYERFINESPIFKLFLWNKCLLHSDSQIPVLQTLASRRSHLYLIAGFHRCWWLQPYCPHSSTPAHPYRYGPSPAHNFIKGNGPKTNTEEKFSAPRLLKQFTRSFNFFLIFNNLLKLGVWYNSLTKHFHLAIQLLWERWPPLTQICSFCFLSVPATPLLLLFDGQPG